MVRREDGRFWYCNGCGAQNSREDGECQFCECGGLSCIRDSCSAPEHFHRDHVSEPDGLVPDICSLCAGYTTATPRHAP